MKSRNDCEPCACGNGKPTVIQGEATGRALITCRHCGQNVEAPTQNKAINLWNQLMTEPNGKK